MSNSRPTLCSQTLDIHEQQVDRWIRENESSRPQLAAKLKRTIGGKPGCLWLGEWTPNVWRAAKDLKDHAKANDSLYQVVLYNIPNRDAGGFSAGGSDSAASYRRWIKDVATGLGGKYGIIILEPDALAHARDFAPAQKQGRLNLLRETAAYLRKKCHNAHIYIDAGHPGWLGIDDVAELLIKAGVKLIDGFSLNVSNSYTTEDCYNYGMEITRKVSRTLGFIIDTSRNGNGNPPESGTGTWANNPTLKIGETPKTRVRQPNNFENQLHALLWVKLPGESDGAYNGGPSAGRFWPEGAERLVRDA